MIILESIARMAKIVFVGSSNVRNVFNGHKTAFEKSSGVKCEYLSATSYTAGIKFLSELQPTGAVVCGFLTNGIVDLVKDPADFSQAEGLIQNYVRAAVSLSLRGQVRVYVLRPMYRAQPPWLSDKLQDIHRLMENFLKGERMVRLVSPFIVNKDDLRTDGLHLTQSALDLFALHLIRDLSVFRASAQPSAPTPSKRKLSVADNELLSKVIRIEASNAASPMDQTSSTSTDAVSITSALTDPQLRLAVEAINANLKETLATQSREVSHKVNLLKLRIDITQREVARQAEIADNAVNLAKSHIILISGLQGQAQPGRQDRNRQASTLAVNFLSEIESNVSALCYATFVPGTNPGPQTLPILKLVMGSFGEAFKVRDKFTVKRIANPAMYQRIFLNPEHTKATRVRIAIMQAIVDKVSKMDEWKDYKVLVTKFEPTPELCFQNKSTKRFERRFSFVDACERFGEALDQDSLVKARRVAGGSFGGRLNSLFIVLAPVPEN